jgi:hypothetical protein
MVVRRVGLALALSISILCGACDDDVCDQIALQLRECCKKGPAELRDGCEDEADMLESDGNEEACEVDLDRGTFARCGE